MKKSKLKQIIREEYYNLTGKTMITEGIVEKIIAMFLTPKINKEVKKIQGTPEYKELEQETKKAVKELELVSKRLERAHSERQDIIAKAAKLGWKLKPWNNMEELLDQVKNRPGRAELLKKYKIDI